MGHTRHTVSVEDVQLANVIFLSDAASHTAHGVHSTLLAVVLKVPVMHASHFVSAVAVHGLVRW